MLWNLTKEGGWSHYKELTNKYSEALEVAIEKEGSIDDKMSCFEKIHDKIKFKVFGKVTVKNNPKKHTIEVDNPEDQTGK